MTLNDRIHMLLFVAYLRNPYPCWQTPQAPLLLGYGRFNYSCMAQDTTSSVSIGLRLPSPCLSTECRQAKRCQPSPTAPRGRSFGLVIDKRSCHIIAALEISIARNWNCGRRRFIGCLGGLCLDIIDIVVVWCMGGRYVSARRWIGH